MKLCYLELSITVSFSIHDRHCVALTALLPLGLHCNSGFTFTPSDNGFTASCLFRAFTPAFSCHMPPGLSGYETVETESTTSLSFLHASNASTIWTTLLIQDVYLVWTLASLYHINSRFFFIQLLSRSRKHLMYAFKSWKLSWAGQCIKLALLFVLVQNKSLLNRINFLNSYTSLPLNALIVTLTFLVPLFSPNCTFAILHCRPA